MKSLKIILFILSFVILSTKTTKASEVRYEQLLLKIYEKCQNYYTDKSVCKCVVNMTIQQIRSGISLLSDNSPDSQIDTHVRGTGAVCEMDLAKQKFN